MAQMLTGHCSKRKHNSRDKIQPVGLVGAVNSQTLPNASVNPLALGITARVIGSCMNSANIHQFRQFRDNATHEIGAPVAQQSLGRSITGKNLAIEHLCDGAGTLVFKGYGFWPSGET